MTKWSFIGKKFRAKKPLELVHVDLCGPTNIEAREGYAYFISFMALLEALLVIEM